MEHVLNILIIFDKKKINNCDPYNVFLAIATNTPVLLMTAFVLQGHITFFVTKEVILQAHAYVLYSICSV